LLETEVVRGKGTGEAVRSAGLPTATGDHAQAGDGGPRGAGFVETLPEVMVFGGGEACPTAGAEIGVGAEAEVGTVDVGVSAVRVDGIRGAKEILNAGGVLRVRVDIDGAGDGGDARFGYGKLVQEPVFGDDAVGVGVGDPALVERAGVTLECHLSGLDASDTDVACVGFDYDAVAVQHAFCDGTGVVGRGVDGDDDVVCDIRGKSGAGLEDGAQAAGEKILFIPSGYEDNDVGERHKGLKDLEIELFAALFFRMRSATRGMGGAWDELLKDKGSLPSA
jgi:hypothetical protein